MIGLKIDNLEVAKAIFDPKLERIITSVKFSSKTVKEIASELDEKQSRLYYPIQKLQNLGLIMVAEERKVGNILEKYYSSKHLYEDDIAYSFEGEFAMEHKEFLISKMMFSLNKGLNVLKRDLEGDPARQENSAMYTEYGLELTTEEWQHLNDEVRKLVDKREGKNEKKEGVKPYKMILFSYKDEENY
ncbi:ArsR family transcriptional regulator [Rossellomorea vietnamensis]|uniref:ArsR family transcriptional regulator n=1 Tax=Rossellomorea vietnamensis TaxID=218284 RepID=UPI003CF07F62